MDMDMDVVRILCGVLGTVGAVFSFVLAWSFRKNNKCLKIFIISGIICSVLLVAAIAMSDGVTWSNDSSEDDFAGGMSEDEFNDFADWFDEQDNKNDKKKYGY